MMKSIRMTLPVLSLLLVAACSSEHAGEGLPAYTFSVQNQLNAAVTDAAVRVNLADLGRRPADCNYVLYLHGNSGLSRSNATSGEDPFFQLASDQYGETRLLEIPSQCDDLNGDGRPDELFFLADFGPEETLEFTLNRVDQAPVYTQRTQAFLRVQTGGGFEDGVYVGGTGHELVTAMDIPAEQVQNSRWAHMEGPVWESDLVGYRFYLDARNRVDIFGKSMPDLVLDTITQNYHQIHPWGTDVLIVGRSLGLGSIAAINAEGTVQTVDNWTSRRFELLVNGPLRSVFRMTYTDWNVFGETITVIADTEIHAGNRYTEQHVTLIGASDGFRLTSGIVRHAGAPVFHHGTLHNSMYGWTTGVQSDQGHGLDMGITVPLRYQPEVKTDDPHTHLITFRPVNGRATYRYTSAWELDHAKVDNFEELVHHTGGLLANPPLVRINR